jgi:hypothetical protein
MSREHEYRPDGQLPAFNPRDGQTWTVLVRDAKAEVIRKRGIGPARELAEIVPPTLLRPNAVFRGLRDRGASNWLCYVGSPTKAYDYENGQRVPPWPGEVFLVFVNDQRVVYNWRWEKADPADPKLPIDFETRFLERLEYRNEP